MLCAVKCCTCHGNGSAAPEKNTERRFSCGSSCLLTPSLCSPASPKFPLVSTRWCTIFIFLHRFHWNTFSDRSAQTTQARDCMNAWDAVALNVLLSAVCLIIIRAVNNYWMAMELSVLIPKSFRNWWWINFVWTAVLLKTPACRPNRFYWLATHSILSLSWLCCFIHMSNWIESVNSSIETSSISSSHRSALHINIACSSTLCAAPFIQLRCSRKFPINNVKAYCKRSSEEKKKQIYK